MEEKRDTDSLDAMRALTHPAWLVALAVLVINDHVLKQSALAGEITGKLSDFAGLLVAPVLVAAILRLGSKRSWYGAGLVVGAVFAAINLSPELAASWDALVSSVALPFHTTPDPTDLVALAAIPAGIEFFSRRAAPVRSQTRRRLALVAIIVGGIACTATSPPPPERQPFSARVSLLNKTHELQVIRISPLLNEVNIDCARIGEAPNEYFEREDFGTPTRWELLSGQEIGIGRNANDRFTGNNDFSNRSCTAALIEGDTFDDIIVFWTQDLETKTFEFSPDIPKRIKADPQTVVLRADYSETPESEMHPWQNRPCGDDATQCSTEERRELARVPTGAAYSWDTVWESKLHHEVEWRPFDQPTEIPEFCEMPGPGQGLVWTEPPATGTSGWVISNIERGIDGCHTFELTRPGTEDTTIDKEWIVCAPYEALTPLGDGTTRNLELRVQTADQSNYTGLKLTYDEVSEDSGVLDTVYVDLTRGADLPGFSGLDFENQLRNGCGPVDAGCHREIPVDVKIDRGPDESVTVKPGDSVEFSGGLRTLHVVRAASVPIVRSTCSDEADTRVPDALGQQPGDYIEAVTVIETGTDQ